MSNNSVQLANIGVYGWQKGDAAAEVKLFKPDAVTEIVSGYVVPLVQEVQIGHEARETVIRDVAGDIGILGFDNETLSIQVTIIGAGSSEDNAKLSLALPRAGGVAACRNFPNIVIGDFGNETVGCINTDPADATLFGTPQWVYKGGAQSVDIDGHKGFSLTLIRHFELTDPSGA